MFHLMENFGTNIMPSKWAVLTPTSVGRLYPLLQEKFYRDFSLCDEWGDIN